MCGCGFKCNDRNDSAPVILWISTQSVLYASHTMPSSLRSSTGSLFARRYIRTINKSPMNSQYLTISTPLLPLYSQMFFFPICAQYYFLKFKNRLWRTKVCLAERHCTNVASLERNFPSSNVSPMGGKVDHIPVLIPEGRRFKNSPMKR